VKSDILDLAKEPVDETFAERVAPDPELLRTCIGCGTCSASCPTGYAMDYTPRQLWRLMGLGLQDEVVNSRTFWLCVTCNACTVRCPRGIPLMETMLALKSYAVQEGIQVPEGLLRLRDTVTANHNISGDPNETRLIWSQNLPHVPQGIEVHRGAEVLYFVGCVGAFYPRVYSIPQSFVQILERAGVNFTTLGGEEWCCGYPLHVAGMGGRVAEMARHNVERIRELGAKKVVFTCPSCYYAWTHLYPDFVAIDDIEPLHATELLAQLIEEQRLELGPVEQVVTYHDPCDLGRKGGVFDAPRFVLQSIPGLELREMANYGENALCCGGGGDVEIAEAEVTGAVGARRLAQAQETGASVIVSACQQCKRTLAEAARKARLRMRVMDLTELVWRSVMNLESEGR
jgi:heterodisulfide reductase subunit D